MIAQGECTPYPRYGESVESVIKAISHAAHELQSLYAKGEADVMALKSQLQSLLPAGRQEMHWIAPFGIFTRF